MFGFASKKTMNEFASDASIVNVDASSGADLGESDPTGTILLNMDSIEALVEDPKPATTIAPLEKSSLHTTCSDASIDLESYRVTTPTNDSGTLKDDDELSFHVSQFENDGSDVLGDGTGLDLTLRPDSDNGGVSKLNDDSNVVENKSSKDDVKHDMETLITVSQQLLKTSPPNESMTNETTNNNVSVLKKYKFFVIFAIVVGGLARGMNRCLDVYFFLSNFFAALDQSMHTSMIREDNINLLVGEFTYRKEEIDSTTSNHNLGWWQIILLGIMAKLALSTTKKCEGQLGTVGSEDVGSFPSEFDTMSPKSLHGSAPVKVPDENPPVVDMKYDLSKYEKLSVMELRALLRARKCTYDGRKTHLIQRLVSVYRAELESMTVVQLRRRLKSKNMKQGGLKRELVQKLLEAGL